MLIGHEKLAEDFRKLAAKNALAHGYVFFGERRIGKKLFALCLANFLEKGEFVEPKILSDFLFLGPDSPSQISRGEIKEGKETIGIDEIRRLRNFLWQKPQASSRRTAVIDDAEKMTAEAQNAILKIAEEPPESSLLILATSDPESLWPTLLSRLQRIYFPNVAAGLIEKWLLEKGVADGKNAEIFAASSFGQPGLAFALAQNEKFSLLSKNAEKFLKSGFWERKNFLKSLLEKEDFNLDEFLEAMLVTISKDTYSRKSELWHKVAALRRDAARYNVNPRLQLEALLSDQ